MALRPGHPGSGCSTKPWWSANPLEMLWPEVDAAFVMSRCRGPPTVRVGLWSSSLPRDPSDGELIPVSRASAARGGRRHDWRLYGLEASDFASHVDRQSSRQGFADPCLPDVRVVMVLFLAALTGTAFGTGVIVGLAIGGSMVASVYACREARRVGVEERPPGTRPEAREEQHRRPGRTQA
jgi:hypothetical protein